MERKYPEIFSELQEARFYLRCVLFFPLLDGYSRTLHPWSGPSRHFTSHLTSFEISDHDCRGDGSDHW